MSDPTRYRVANNQAQLTLGGGILAVDPAGPLVMYDDYARLHSLFANSEQDNARLKTDVNDLAEGLKLSCEVGIKIADEVTRLKAEVERLRKAGDGMASSIQFNEEMEKDYDGPTIVHPSVERWNAAKEGKV